MDTEIVSIDSNTYHLNQDLNDNSEYFWKVHAIDMTGKFQQQNTLTFSQMLFPSLLAIFQPYIQKIMTGIGTEITFSWNRSNDPGPR